MTERDDGLRAEIAAALRTFVVERRAAYRTLGPEVAALIDTLADASTGGKLVRPVFCYWGWRAAGGAAEAPALVRASVALELLHAGALVHDDVLDSSDTRRGRPSVHRSFAAEHERRRWAGEPTAFGTAAAILLGDLCLAWSDEALRGSGLPADVVARGFDVFDLMRSEVMFGQYLDIVAQASTTRSVEVARTVVRLKSASYTIQRPLQLGAALAGGDDGVAAALAAYGRPVGEAFQLRDDLLGMFGDSVTTGKPAGDDLREGKRTVLLTLAYGSATPGQSAVLDRAAGNRALDADDLAAAREVMVATGAVDRVEAMIGELRQRGRDALQAIAHDEAKAALEQLAATVTDRVR